MPFHLLHDNYLEMVLKEKINLELGFDCFTLDRYKKEDFLKVANILLDSGLTITMHAPFMDVRPGAIDPRIREASISRLDQFFEIVSCFKPKTVVCHASFDERYYVGCREVWVENSIETWTRFVRRARELDTIITLENVYENSPHYLAVILDSFKSPSLRFCFDTGHFNAFSEASLEEWMEYLGPYLKQLHLHDNNGCSDDHIPVGNGKFPFRKLFEIIDKKGLDPIITLEPHTEKDMWLSIKNIREMKLLKGVAVPIHRDCNGGLKLA